MRGETTEDENILDVYEKQSLNYGTVSHMDTHIQTRNCAVRNRNRNISDKSIGRFIIVKCWHRGGKKRSSFPAENLSAKRKATQPHQSFPSAL